MAFVPEQAPLMVLAFLAAVGLTGLAGVAFLWSLGAGRFVRAVRIAGSGALVLALYGSTWLWSARTLPERTLAPGESKYFCEIDCHLAYTVQAVERVTTLGEGAAAVNAEGVFLVVTVRTWFDERTISARRGVERPLRPGLRDVRVVDGTGRSWQTSLAGQKGLRGSTVPAFQPIRPGESFDSQYVFDVPADIESPRLLVTDRFPLSALLIGHENAPGAGRIYFALEDGRVAGN